MNSEIIGFEELTNREIMDCVGGNVSIKIPVVGPVVSVQATYTNRAAGYTAAWTVGGIVAGSCGGPIGAVCGGVGNFIAQTACSTMDGNVKWSLSWF